MATAAMSQKTFQNLLPSYAVLYIRPLLFLRLLFAPVLSLRRCVPASPLLPEAYFHLPFPHCCCRFRLKNRLPGNLLTVYTLSSWRDRCPVTQCVFFGVGFPRNRPGGNRTRRADRSACYPCAVPGLLIPVSVLHLHCTGFRPASVHCRWLRGALR